MIANLLGTLVPVLAYGVLCAALGIWVHSAYVKHWRKR